MRPETMLLFAVVTGLPAPLAGQTLVAPRTAGMDAVLDIAVVGAIPGASLNISVASPDSEGRLWTASAEFVADQMGRVALSKDAPVRGSYSGVDPMGLIATMTRDGGDARFRPAAEGGVPLHVVLAVEGRSVDSLTITRHIAPSGVVGTTPEPSSGIVGTLFLPETGRPAPGLLVLGGSEGGDSGAALAAQLAGHGFAALSVAYFGAPGVPDELDQIPLEYFSDAVTWMQSQLGVSSESLGILGTSKGAEAALLVAARDARFRAVVAYAPSSVAWSCICQSPENPSWTWGGEPVPGVGPGRDPDYAVEPGQPMTPAVHYRYRMTHWPDIRDARIVVEDIAGPLMVVAGGADELWPSGVMAAELAVSRRASSHSAGDIFLTYPDAGHLIGKAYLPAGSTRIAGGRIETGGSPRANSIAQADAWPQVLTFLTRELR